MQKNKFIHEDIKAVCNSATKKLLAMGLVATVGVSSQVYGSYTHTVSAQSFDHEFDHEISDNGNTLVNGDGVTTVKGNGSTEVVGRGETFVLGSGVTQVAGSGVTQVAGSGETFVLGGSTTTVIGNGNTTVMGNGNTFVAGAGVATVISRGTTRVDGTGHVYVRGARSMAVYGTAPIEATGHNRIEAREGTTVYSVSSNLFTHDGQGAGIIDAGNIEFSGLSEDRLTRDVTVERANSLTVAPGISTRIRNGTAFPMGKTLRETAENILRALSPTSRQNIINGFANQNETGDEMKEERENNNTSSSQGGGFLSMINPFNWFGGSK